LQFSIYTKIMIAEVWLLRNKLRNPRGIMIITMTELQQLQALCDSKHKIIYDRGPNGGGDLNPLIPANRWAIMEIHDWRAQHPLRCEECIAASKDRTSGHLAGGTGI
jgi:hypothetical protein